MEPTELRPSFEQKISPPPERKESLDTRLDQEKNREKSRAEQEPGRTEKTGTAAEQGKKRFFNPLRKPTAAVPATMGKDELSSKIEKVLEENIGEAYQLLSPSGKQAFKIKGEKTTAMVKEMIESGHAKARKIFSLVLEWLRLLPGVNRFFLEQEAKIKTDRLMKIGHKE